MRGLRRIEGHRVVAATAQMTVRGTLTRARRGLLCIEDATDITEISHHAVDGVAVKGRVLIPLAMLAYLQVVN